MEGFSLLIKPAAADCNLSCRYCFYLSRADLYPLARVHRMSDEVLTKVIASYLATDQQQYVFGWQGGEPTLMGAEFFRRVTELEQKYGRAGCVVSNGLQTNATLIDDQLARHLARYRFLVGVSLDGPAEIHDAYRKTRGGQSSHADVVRGIRKLEAQEAEFNILVLVNDINVTRAREVYRYLCDNRWYYHQFIPCVEFGENNEPLPFSVSAQKWGDFLCALFDEWIASGVGRVSIRLFDAILARLLEKKSVICHMDHDCRQYFVVEYNGDIYPCDFFVDRELKLGNVLEHSWQSLRELPKYRDFGLKKSIWHTACNECPYLYLCAGDCLKHRGPAAAATSNLSFLCDGWKTFFKHSLSEFRRIAANIERERIAAPSGVAPPVPLPRQGKTGRNDPCPCGSGRKFKKCCMNK